MQNISEAERESIRKAHLGALCIVVTAHVPQSTGGCHPFIFVRGGLSAEKTAGDIFKRVREDILQHILRECNKSCICNDGQPVIGYRKYGNP